MPSLRRSAVLAFLRFGAVLIGLYAFVTAVLTAMLEDRVLGQRLEVEAEAYSARLASAPEAGDLEPPRTRFMNGYVGLDAVPADLRPEVEDFGPGIHEVGDSWREGPDLMVAVRDLPKDHGRLFLFYDISQLEQSGEWVLPIGLILLSGALIVGPLGLWWGRRLADDLVGPVVDLADTVAATPPERLASGIEVEHYEGEVGQLATALRQAFDRVEAFVRRERRFTRNASHELRTPVTVARGAAELLAARLDPEDSRAHAQLDRVARSVGRMEEIIEAFLWLAREEGSGAAGPCRPAELLPEVVEQHRHLLADRPVEVNLELDHDLRVDAPAAVVSIVAGNLVSNAFYSTLEGRVDIAIGDAALRVQDTGSGWSEEAAATLTEPFVSGRPESGHGLGLAIVREICERFGWRLELAPAGERGARAEVCFEPAGDRPRADASRGPLRRAAVDVRSGGAAEPSSRA